MAGRSLLSGQIFTTQQRARVQQARVQRTPRTTIPSSERESYELLLGRERREGRTFEILKAEWEGWEGTAAWDLPGESGGRMAGRKRVQEECCCSRGARQFWGSRQEAPEKRGGGGRGW